MGIFYSPKIVTVKLRNHKHLKYFENVYCVMTSHIWSKGHVSKPQFNHKLITVAANNLVISSLIWLLPLDTITFQKYFWCSGFSEFDSNSILLFGNLECTLIVFFSVLISVCLLMQIHGKPQKCLLQVVLKLQFVLFIITIRLNAAMDYSRKNPQPPDGWQDILTPPPLLLGLPEMPNPSPARISSNFMEALNLIYNRWKRCKIASRRSSVVSFQKVGKNCNKSPEKFNSTLSMVKLTYG